MLSVNNNLNFNFIQVAAFLAWRHGNISLGKMAELIKMDKAVLRGLLANMGLPIIDYPVDELEAELDFLLSNSGEQGHA